MGCGAKVIAISDYTGAIYDPKGIDIEKACAYLRYARTLEDYHLGEHITNEQLLELKCTVLLSAALERVITKDNAPKLQCRIIAEPPTARQPMRLITLSRSGAISRSSPM